MPLFNIDHYKHLFKFYYVTFTGVPAPNFTNSEPLRNTPVPDKVKLGLSYDVVSGSEITPCNKNDKPLVVYRFSGNVIMSITTLRT